MKPAMVWLCTALLWRACCTRTRHRTQFFVDFSRWYANRLECCISQHFFCCSADGEKAFPSKRRKARLMLKMQKRRCSPQKAITLLSCQHASAPKARRKAFKHSAATQHHIKTPFSRTTGPSSSGSSMTYRYQLRCAGV